MQTLLALQAFLLAIIRNEENGNYYFESKSECLLYALIGFVIVFIGICFIILILWLIGLLMKKTNGMAFLTNHKSHKKNKESALAAEVIAEQTKQAGATEKIGATEEEIPDEVKAAIVAAIMAYYAGEQTQCEFKVKRIKRL